MRAMMVQRGVDRCALARQPVVVDAGAAAGPARGAAAEQRRAQHRRGRRVGNSHLADGEQIAILRHGAITDIDRAQKFVVIHRRRDGEVARRPVEFDRHHAQFGAGKCCDLVDGGAAGGEIRHHLCGHRLRIGGDAAVRHAVIAGKDRDRDALQPRQFAAPASAPARSPALRGGRGFPAALSGFAAGGRRPRLLARHPRASRDRRRGCRLECRTACDSLVERDAYSVFKRSRRPVRAKINASQLINSQGFHHE